MPTALAPGHDIGGAVYVAATDTPNVFIWRCPCGATFRASTAACRRVPRCRPCDPTSRRGRVGETTQPVLVMRSAIALSLMMPEFSEQTLTVCAWGDNMEAFGLRGFAHSHPDHKLVMSVVCKSLVPNGWLARTQPNYYRVTDKGREAIAAIDAAKKGKK